MTSLKSPPWQRHCVSFRYKQMDTKSNRIGANAIEDLEQAFLDLKLIMREDLATTLLKLKQRWKEKKLS